MRVGKSLIGVLTILTIYVVTSATHNIEAGPKIPPTKAEDYILHRQDTPSKENIISSDSISVSIQRITEEINRTNQLTNTVIRQQEIMKAQALELENLIDSLKKDRKIVIHYYPDTVVKIERIRFIDKVKNIFKPKHK